uniref:T9SS type A sorting domain-containing protein n=1 Tax=Taibaiella helva TaxID=2301235 RepID=UPI0013002C81
VYSYTDKTPLRGNNYYRLKQTDKDGIYEYSEVRQLSFESGSSISIHPNPAKDYVIIDGLDGGETIKVYDATGRIVREINQAQSSVKLFLDGLSEGLYHVSITGMSGNTVSGKMMKTK